MPERATWASKAGFVLASAGAAVGLGAIWKFPWLAGSNGGAVFVIPYVILSLTLGFVFLTAEITLGYMGRGSIVTTMRKLGGSKWVPAGYLGVVTGLLVLSFYSVIGGARCPVRRAFRRPASRGWLSGALPHAHRGGCRAQSEQGD